jgi:hypothetical protein
VEELRHGGVAIPVLHDPGRIKGLVTGYAVRVREMGYSAMTSRYEALLARA